tara:strand:+ start:4625 stop:5590 length:966 start_codon:yes stop_codon:yes gene_type:complete
MINNSIAIKDNREIIFGKIPDFLEIDGCGTLEMMTSFKGNKLKGWYKEQVLDNIKIGYGLLDADQNLSINFNYKGQTIELIYVLKGSFGIKNNKRLLDNNWKENEHNIIYYTSTTGTIEIPRGANYIVRINLSLSFFNQFLPEENKFKNFRKQIKKNRTGKLKRENYTITSKMHLIINEILNSERKGFYRKIHINAIVLELLLLQLDQYNRGKLDERNPFEEEKIIQVKEYLVKNYTRPLTLQFLSSKFGTNEFALKKGFKAVFGITVFGYIADLKMYKARELLSEKRLPVGEVSEIVGYKNPQHFSTAFKKKFGIRPSKI